LVQALSGPVAPHGASPLAALAVRSASVGPPFLEEEIIMAVKHWQDPTNVVLGLWMVASPWVLQYQGVATPAANAIIVGIAIAALAVVALFRLMAWEEWANVALGVWLVISPWILGFSALDAATWNAVIVGLVVATLALWELGTDKDLGGWWRPAT
jgi:hypothetical protein